MTLLYLTISNVLVIQNAHYTHKKITVTLTKAMRALLQVWQISIDPH